jgi:hypothetical protein
VNLDDYNTVPERIEEFRTKHPDGRLRPVDPTNPFQIIDVAGKTFVAYAAFAYRAPDDPLPGCGCAWEPFPGATNFTRNSELQNAETSAWGRAIVAALIADAKKGIATAEDIQNRQGDPPPTDTPTLKPGHALVEAAGKAGFGIPAGADKETKEKKDQARRDVLQAATGKRSSKGFTAAEYKTAIAAFVGLADGTLSYGEDEDGVPTLITVNP